MFYALVVGVIVFFVANLFLPAGLAGLIGLAAGIAVLLVNTDNRRR